jgi:hypothetical protein
MLHIYVTFFAGTHIFYDGNKIYFRIQHFLPSIGYGKICFEFSHSFTAASDSRGVNLLVL